MPDVLDPERIFATLAEHRVEYVVIGGLAAVLHGAPTVTNDADICPRRTPENLSRLAAALDDMHARIRTPDEPEGAAFTSDGTFLAQMKMVNLITDFGAFDISFEPAAFDRGYDDLVDCAETFSISGVRIPVARLRDVIASKETADRPKDRAVLPILRSLEDEIERRGD